MRIAIVKAAHDDEAGVWYVEASDVDGLHVEGETFESFCRNVAGAVADLLEGQHDGAGEIPVEIIAHASAPDRVESRAISARPSVSRSAQRAAPSCAAAKATTTFGRRLRLPSPCSPSSRGECDAFGHQAAARSLREPRPLRASMALWFARRVADEKRPSTAFARQRASTAPCRAEPAQPPQGDCEAIGRAKRLKRSGGVAAA
ncbi:MAG: DUF1902 domain-containing protein [Roseiarcus sp.]